MDDDKKPISLILTTKEYHRILEAQHRSMTKSFAEFMRASALKEAARILDAETETKPAGV